jgi:hypothetical protein
VLLCKDRDTRVCEASSEEQGRNRAYYLSNDHHDGDNKVGVGEETLLTYRDWQWRNEILGRKSENDAGIFHLTTKGIGRRATRTPRSGQHIYRRCLA